LRFPGVFAMTRQGGWPASGFGVRLRLFREGAGLNQSQLAETAGTTQATVARLEAGHQEPAWPLVLALAKALGVTANDFQPREGDARPGPPKRGRPPRAKPATAAEDLEGQTDPRPGADAPRGRSPKEKPAVAGTPTTEGPEREGKESRKRQGK
jgi:transcriptional regulator with XRE-family HTH domain